jgi:hypothetical protein
VGTNVVTVTLAALATALATGLGAVPFSFVSSMSRHNGPLVQRGLIRNGKPRAPLGALGNSASAGGRVGVESLDVAGTMRGLDAVSWHTQLERALAERYTDDEVFLRLGHRAGRRAAMRDGGPARARAGRLEERRGLIV